MQGGHNANNAYNAYNAYDAYNAYNAYNPKIRVFDLCMIATPKVQIRRTDFGYRA